ncbi:membrane-spanning 4-domains subfamily A member 4D-like isoform X2 [Tachyglossus aculeatus]|uniref:membrane-spanning 4-domains subfamily A member 4D-like isoform X2 n=1 Tax=Tachyglossus aculeatus TaxID=9261 RepID=UPI0018F409F4|nr:membrane-spanning 4-domains subfamily A member 4D-like isoform X2 [Tachyglossus aculeatus]
MTSTDSIDPNIMELQPVFTQPSNHNLQPSQAVASGASNPQNGILKKFLKGEPKVLGFIISGCLSVAAAENHTKCLMQGCLITNIISMLFAGSGIIIFLQVLLHFPSQFHQFPFLYGMLFMELWLICLEFCIMMSLSVFGCKAVCVNTSQTVIYQSPNSHGPVMAFQESDYESLTNLPQHYDQLVHQK